MGRKACVTNCNGNYENDLKKKGFMLPQNEEKKRKVVEINITRQYAKFEKYRFLQKTLAKNV